VAEGYRWYPARKTGIERLKRLEEIVRFALQQRFQMM
jgi:hypothetical protein